MRIVVTRPEPDARTQAEALRARGHDTVLAPMLDVTLLHPDLSGLKPLGIAGAVVTSRNALRALAEHPIPEAIAAAPLFCVGEATATLARHAGFRNVISSDGDADGLLSRVAEELSPARGAILRFTGDIPSKSPQRLSEGLRANGFGVEELICYRVRPVKALPATAETALRDGAVDLVILMSPLIARTWLSAIAAASLTLRSDKPGYVCLSAAVASVLEEIPANCKFIADKPNHSKLLSIVDRAVAELS